MGLEIHFPLDLKWHLTLKFMVKLTKQPTWYKNNILKTQLQIFWNLKTKLKYN